MSLSDFVCCWRCGNSVCSCWVSSSRAPFQMYHFDEREISILPIVIEQNQKLVQKMFQKKYEEEAQKKGQLRHPGRYIYHSHLFENEMLIFVDTGIWSCCLSWTASQSECETYYVDLEEKAKEFSLSCEEFNWEKWGFWGPSSFYLSKKN
jgi:hypothetical protein